MLVSFFNSSKPLISVENLYKQLMLIIVENDTKTMKLSVFITLRYILMNTWQLSTFFDYNSTFLAKVHTI